MLNDICLNNENYDYRWSDLSNMNLTKTTNKIDTTQNWFHTKSYLNLYSIALYS